MAYAPPKLKSNREVFDFVRQHLLKQNARSASPDQACLYRAPDGCMCAVGCLISDKLYKTDIEGNSVYDDGIQTKVKRSIGFAPDQFMLAVLQRLHDTVPVSEWAEKLETIHVPD